MSAQRRFAHAFLFRDESYVLLHCSASCCPIFDDQNFERLNSYISKLVMPCVTESLCKHLARQNTSAWCQWLTLPQSCPIRKWQDAVDDGKEERRETCSLSSFSAYFPTSPAPAIFLVRDDWGRVSVTCIFSTKKHNFIKHRNENFHTAPSISRLF